MFFKFQRRKYFNSVIGFLNHSLEGRSETELIAIRDQVNIDGLIIGFSKHKLEGSFQSVASLNDDLFRKYQVSNEPSLRYSYGKYIDVNDQISQPILVTYKGVFVRIESGVLLKYSKYKWVPEELVRFNAINTDADLVWDKIPPELKGVVNYSDVNKILIKGTNYFYLCQLDDERHIIMRSNNDLYEVSSDYRDIRPTQLTLKEIVSRIG